TVPAALRPGDLSPQICDFGDTAAALSVLDLVITIDTSVAHLAGALGKPAWVMLPADPDWRWMRVGDRSPWYPSMRLFRQTEDQHWDGVVTQVAQALRDLTGLQEREEWA
ncbi:MAG: glycosyl transferase family 8, partial [Bacteroidetes bacterium]|nr:glycosyl transferase family 8 [Bacteroidota bacterium]